MPKVLYFLSLLSESELKRFYQFLSSPYFNRQKDLPGLCKVLQVVLDKPKSANWEQAAYKSWKRNEVFDLNRFRQACSALVKLLHQFIGQELYQQQESLVQTHQVQALDEHEDLVYFPRILKKLKQLHLANLQAAQVNDFWLMSELYATELSHQTRHPNRKASPALLEAAQYLDTYYLIQRMKYEVGMISQEHILGVERLPSGIQFQDLKTLCEAQGDPNHWDPLIQAYYLLICAQTNLDKEELYHQLKALLTTYPFHVSATEMRNLINGIFNYCSLQMRQGKPAYRDEMGWLYQLMIDRDIIWIDGKVLAWDVVNLTIYHLEKGNFEWVEAFRKKCRTRLIPIQRRQVELFCKGLSTYYRKEYKKALRMFDQLLADFDDVFYGLNVRVAKARLLYTCQNTDRNYLESFEKLLDSAPVYIRSKEVADTHKERNLNFFKFLKRLHKLDKANSSKLTLFKLEVEAESRISSRNWLLAEIEKKS